MVEISQSAARRLAELLASGEGLRISVERGGCAGLRFTMSLDSQRDGDVVFTCAGGRVFVDQGSVPYLGGSALVYEDRLNGGGFRIQNPRAVRSCGCGTSFEVSS
jgi:iron-sulfur cluster assembly protein